MHIDFNGLTKTAFPGDVCTKHATKPETPAVVVVTTRDGYNYPLCMTCFLKLTCALETVIENTLKNRRELLKQLRD